MSRVVLLLLLSTTLAACAARRLPTRHSPEQGPCARVEGGFVCASQTHKVTTSMGVRNVHVALPQGAPPSTGWPVVFAFQGSWFPAHLWFVSDTSLPFGGVHQGVVTRRLLDAGFAVVAPETRGGGLTYWETNQPYAMHDWARSDDHQMMLALFDAVRAGDYGPLDDDRLFAMGVSSGGYMTSRMAVSYPGRFRRLAIMSASYATCGGPVCNLPDVVPPRHPPTMFLHGERDTVVPPQSMQLYARWLAAHDVVVEEVRDAAAGHGWIRAAPDAIVRFFKADGAPPASPDDDAWRRW